MGYFKCCLVLQVLTAFKRGSKLNLPKSALKQNIACIIDDKQNCNIDFSHSNNDPNKTKLKIGQFKSRFFYRTPLKTCI